MSMEQKTEHKARITHKKCDEEKEEGMQDRKCDKTPKTTRNWLTKEKNWSNSKIPMRVKGPDNFKIANEKVTVDECTRFIKSESNSKQLQQKEIKYFNIEEISKEIFHHKSDGLKTPNNSTKDCTSVMKALTIETKNENPEKNGSNNGSNSNLTPKASQESKNISPKLPLSVKPQKYSAHSGLTLKPKAMKGTMPSPFAFQSKPKIIMRSKSVTEKSAATKIKKRASSVKRTVTFKDEDAKGAKEKNTLGLKENCALASASKSKTPEVPSSDPKKAPIKKYPAFGGLRFKPKRVVLQLKTDIFDSNVIKMK
ncbi:uncharacterized protein NPIL_394332 [Nephila pilipes]|uniref:Uncharacterized protein n=1 Tax=Nephila pilipes TaxID=299642 RepID=A0A8X6MIM2_NEPPI|nr:uncharacterized protein NPIL_394332 [Nephila pilipes]